MNSSAGNKIKLGIFIFLGMLLFILGIYYIGNRQKIFGNTFRAKAIFGNVNGLQVGNNVRFSGINVGIIENMEQVSDTTVRVDMLIEEKVRKFIKKDAKAVIGSEGLMGNKTMIIAAGTPGQREIEHDDFLVTSQSVTMDDILQKLKITSENAAEITSDLATITANITSGQGTVGMLFMDTVFAMNLYEAIVNVKRGSKEFEENMEAAGKSFLLKRFLKNRDKKEEEEEKKAKEEEKESKEETRKIRRKKRKEEKKMKISLFPIGLFQFSVPGFFRQHQ